MGKINLGQVAAYIESVEVEPLDAPSAPTVRNEGTAQNAKLVFGLPTLAQADLDKIEDLQTNTASALADLQLQIDDAAEKFDASAAALQKKIDSAKTQSNGATIHDTRDESESPKWYMANFPQSVRYEFKISGVLGVSGAGIFGTLATYTGWRDTSAIESISQHFYSNNSYWSRNAVNENAWSAWVKHW